MNSLSKLGPRRRHLIINGIPHYMEMGSAADDPAAMAAYRDHCDAHGLTPCELLAFADSPVHHNGRHLPGDRFNRWIGYRLRRFVRNVVGAHFVPAVDLGS